MGLIRKLFNRMIKPKQKSINTKKSDGTIIRPINTIEYIKDRWNKFYCNPNFYNISINGYPLNSYAMYKKIVDEDGTIRSALRERKLKITSLNWEVFYNKTEPISNTEKQIKNKITSWLKRIDIETKIYTMLEALDYGEAIFQIMYEYTNGIWEVIDLQKRNIEHFDYLKENQHLVYFSNGYNSANYVDLTENYPYQFIVHRNNANALNPHGESEIGLYGYVLYNMKKQFLINYGVTGEKHGDPSLIATVNSYDKEGRPDPNLEDKLYEVAETALESLDGINSRAIVDERVRIEHLQQEIKNSFDYSKAIDLISRLEEIHIKGSTLTSDTGEYGNYSTSKTHERTTNALIKSDIRELNNTINRMIRMWIELNFGINSTEQYPEFRIIEPELIDNERASIIFGLIDRGLEVRKKAIADEFNISISDNLSDKDCFNIGGEK